MYKSLFFLLAISGMIFFTQCTDDQVVPDDVIVDDAHRYGGGKGGSGSGGGKGGSGAGTEGGLYGDLVVCYRDADGIPEYKEVVDEHGLSYYPKPIMIDAYTLEPLKINGVYQTFDLNAEGEPIPQEGYLVQEVEFGRLNVVRAPQSVLDAALNEAINGLQQPGVTTITTDASGRLVAIVGAPDWEVNYDDNPLNDEFNDKTIDSPRENVAIYQELMSNGFQGNLSFLTKYGFTGSELLQLCYGAIAGGADKTGIMTVDEFGYMNNWLLKWETGSLIEELPTSPDVKKRRYFNYRDFIYDRVAIYGNKFVRIRVLYPNGTWKDTYHSLLEVVPWTDPAKLIDYSDGTNTNVSGFANAANDAVQVLEFIHGSDLIVYSPIFKAETIQVNNPGHK